MKKETLLALLSMDAYNRKYNVGIDEMLGNNLGFMNIKITAVTKMSWKVLKRQVFLP